MGSSCVSESVDRPEPAVHFAWVLRLAASCLFLGRGYLYLSGFAPLSAFFWKQDWLAGPLLYLTGLPWEAYAASSEPFITQVQRLMGGLFLVCAVAVWRCGRGQRMCANGIVLAGTVCLLPFWLLRWFDANLQSGMFLEHFLQWGTPLLLLLYFRIELRSWRWVAWLFVSLTFIGHGQYATGWGVPVDHDFVNMTQSLLPVSEQGARNFLRIAGVVDFLLPLLLLVRPLRIPAAFYAASWGCVTACARVVAHWTPAENYYGMHPWLSEAVVRLPHALVPLILLLLYWQERRAVRRSEPTRVDRC